MTRGNGAEHWIFGYGSLMWRPDFPFLERASACVTGYHRSFCVTSTHHRGSPDRPGLVLGLDRGRACIGVAYRIADVDWAGVVDYLRQRELIYGVYREAHVPAVLLGPERRAVCAVAYIVERAHPSYVGRQPLARQVHLIRGARGLSGANLDYLINTVAHLKALGIRERELERIVALAGSYSANSPTTDLARPSADAMCKTWAQKPDDAIRRRRGDLRRFGYRLRLKGGAHA